MKRALFALALIASCALVGAQSPPPVPTPSVAAIGGAAPPMDAVEALRRIVFTEWHGKPLSATVTSTALEASHVLKASAGALVSLTVTDSAAEYIMIINATTVPSDGVLTSGTLLFPPIKVSANTTTMVNFPAPLAASTGIVVCNSSTGTYTKTIGGSTCLFTGQVQ
jgi:hypothetical protein